MMRFLRGRVAKLIFGVILVAFLAWIVAELGMEGRIGRSGNEVARVNGEGILSQEFSMLYNQELEEIWRPVRSYMTEEDEAALRKEVLSRLIDQTLLWQEAKRLDLAVTSQEAQANIRSLPVFRNEQGQFDPIRYEAVLSRMGIPSQLFEIQHERSLSVARLESFLREGVRVTDLELWLEYLRWHREMRALILAFPISEVKESIKVPESDVKEYWLQNRQSFEKPERVRIRHIYIASRPEGGPEGLAQAKAQAEAILTEIKAGGNFEEIAKTRSQDSGTAARGGDLGWHLRGRLIPEYESVVFKLRPGQMSGVVQIPQGFSIIRCDGYQAEEKPTYEELKGRIRNIIRTSRAREKQAREATRAQWLVKKREDGDLEKAAGELGRKCANTGWFKGMGVPPPGLTKGVFDALAEHFAGLEPGDTTDLISLDEGFYMVKLLEDRYGKASEEGFIKERERIENALLRRKRRAAVAAWLDALRDKADIKRHI